MKKIVKIVLTGGPCGGKSSGLKRIKEETEKLGYKVVIINESATELIENGLSLNAYNGDKYSFQKNIISLQMLKEKLYYEACQRLPDEKILLLCDRGVMDSLIYMPDKMFFDMIKELGQELVPLRDNYDGVFHLVSCAVGAEKFYTCENNKSRSETVEEARELDNRGISVWTGTPHLRIIDNSTDFDGKMKRLMQEITALLGEPEPLEIERKFLIEMPDRKFLENLPNCKKVNIQQTYLPTPSGTERIRQRGDENASIYFHTFKKSISPMKRIEIEERITEEEYLKILSSAGKDLRSIQKERYCLVENGKYFELDVFPFAKKRAILEIELNSEDEQFELPKFVNVIKEVTGEKRFSNKSLAVEVPEELY